MPQDWFVIRNGKETGPYSPAQLKQMAATGKLVPDALVRRSDMQTPRKASTIKGLFAAVKVAPVPVPTDATSSPSSATETSPPVAKKRVPSKKTLIMASVVGGAFLFLCCGSCGIMGFIGIREGQQVKKELAEADTLWQSGKKAEAVAIYRAKKDSAFFDGNDRAVGYGRLIDYEYETGEATGGKALIDEADKKGVTPTVNNAEAKSVLAAMQAEKDRIEAERREQERKKADEKAQAQAAKQEKEKSEAAESTNTFKVSKGFLSGDLQVRVLVPDEITVSDLTLNNWELKFKLLWRNPIGRPIDPWHYSAYDKDGVKIDGGAVIIPDSMELGQKIKAHITFRSEDVKEITRVDIHQ